MNKQHSFLTNKSEMVERWDSYFYKPEFHDFRKYLKSIGCVFLKNYIDSWNRGDGPRDGYYSESLDDDRVPFIRVNNLKNHTIDKTNIKFIHRNIHNTKLKRTQVTSGDLIFAISGTKDNLGTLAIIPEGLKDANLNSALVRLDLSEELDKFFLCILFELNFVRKQIDIIGKGAAQNNLNNKEIGSIQIPKLSLESQRKFVEIYNLAFNASININLKAKEKLDSIDTYLLEKLGINLTATNSDLQKRIFIVDASKALGKRLDPNFYKNFYQGIIESVQRSPNQKLSKLINFSSETWDQKSGFDSSFPYVEISEIDIPTGVVRNILDVPIQNAPSRAKMVVRNGDILVSLTRPNRGAITLYTDKLSIASTGFAVLRNSLQENERKSISEYLWYILRSKICLLQMEQRSTGGNYPAITQDELGNILIPLPSIQEQKQIVAHIRQLRVEAKKLEEEANLVLENAKEEIEKMILGETV